MGRLTESHDSLTSSWSELEERWADARQQWRDSIGHRFEREWWQPLETEVPRLLEAMAELDETLEQALRRTED